MQTKLIVEQCNINVIISKWLNFSSGFQNKQSTVLLIIKAGRTHFPVFQLARGRTVHILVFLLLFSSKPNVLPRITIKYDLYLRHVFGIKMSHFFIFNLVSALIIIFHRVSKVWEPFFGTNLRYKQFSKMMPMSNVILNICIQLTKVENYLGHDICQKTELTTEIIYHSTIVLTGFTNKHPNL